VPIEIGNLTALEALDLSNNRLQISDSDLLAINRSSPVQFARPRVIVLRAELARGRAYWTIHRIGGLNSCPGRER